MFKKININLLLFIIVIFEIVSLVKSVSEKKKDIEEMKQDTVVSATMTKVEKTDENMRLFREEQLDEKYNEKFMYRLDLRINNPTTEPIDLHYEFFWIDVKSAEGNYFSCARDEYYAGMPKVGRPRCDTLPSGTEMVVSYYVILDTYDFTELRVYPWMGSDEYVVVEMN